MNTSRDDADKAIEKIKEIQSFVNKAGKNLNKQDITIREHADRILSIEQSAIPGLYEQPNIGAQFSFSKEIRNSNEVQSFIERKNKSAGLRLSAKSVLLSIQNSTTTSTSATNPPQQLPGVVGKGQQKIFLRSFLTDIPATGSSFNYTREVSFTNNAASQDGEGALKAESDISFEEVIEQIPTIAHWLKTTRQVMSDNPALVEFKMVRLRNGLELIIENQMINGDGLASTMNGLLKAGNFTPFTPESGDTQIDSVRKGILALENTNEFMCNLIIMNQNDVAAIELLKDVDGNYIVGKPIDGGLHSLWGKPLLASKAMATGEFIVLDTTQAVTTHTREDALVEFSNSDSDNFVKNLVTILAEVRMGFAVHLPAGVISGALTV